MIAGFVALMITHSKVLPVTQALYPTEDNATQRWSRTKNSALTHSCCVAK